jgi:hypothetical protein
VARPARAPLRSQDGLSAAKTDAAALDGFRSAQACYGLAGADARQREALCVSTRRSSTLSCRARERAHLCPLTFPRPYRYGARN